MGQPPAILAFVVIIHLTFPRHYSFLSVSSPRSSSQSRPPFVHAFTSLLLFSSVVLFFFQFASSSKSSLCLHIPLLKLMVLRSSMVPHNDNTPTSQITLSQYEYRVVRLPKRDYTRRRRHRQSLNSISSVQRQLVTESEADLLVVPSSETTADDADTSQLLNVQSLESNERRQHSPQPNKVSAQQHFHSSSIPNIANESQLYPHVDAIPLASTSPLPMPMQMQMNDDDRELLRLASPCDSDVPLRDADKSRGSRSEIRALTPGSATPTRGSVDSSCQDERPRRPTKKATKKRKNKLSDLNLLGNQLVMVAGEPEHTVSVNVLWMGGPT